MAIKLRFWQGKHGIKPPIRLYYKGKHSVKGYVEEGSPFNLVVRDQTGPKHSDVNNLHPILTKISEQKVVKMEEYLLDAIEECLQHARSWGQDIKTFEELAFYVKSIEEEEKAKNKQGKMLARNKDKTISRLAKIRALEQENKKS